MVLLELPSPLPPGPPPSSPSTGPGAAAAAAVWSHGLQQQGPEHEKRPSSRTWETSAYEAARGQTPAGGAAGGTKATMSGWRLVRAQHHQERRHLEARGRGAN